MEKRGLPLLHFSHFTSPSITDKVVLFAWERLILQRTPFLRHFFPHLLHRRDPRLCLYLPLNCREIFLLSYLLNFFPNSAVEVNPWRTEYEGFSGLPPLFSPAGSGILYDWLGLLYKCLWSRSDPILEQQFKVWKAKSLPSIVCPHLYITLGSTHCLNPALMEPARPRPAHKLP